MHQLRNWDVAAQHASHSAAPTVPIHAASRPMRPLPVIVIFMGFPSFTLKTFVVNLQYSQR